MRIAPAQLLFIAFTAFFGCAEKSALSKFDLPKEQERALNSVTLGKIEQNGELYAIVEAICLNLIDPKRYKNESFYIVIATKKKGLLHRITLELDGKSPLRLVKLPQKNDYTNLTGIDNEWNDYYFVEFPPIHSRKLKLRIELSNGAEATVDFQKK